MSAKNKAKIIAIFNELYRIHTTLENKYEAKSYKKILDILGKYPGEIHSSADLRGVPGIGKRTLIKIDEIIATGKLRLLGELKRDPEIMARLSLQGILGIGPKTARDLVETHGIYSPEKLRKAIRDNNKHIAKLTAMQAIGLKYWRELARPIPRREITAYAGRLRKIMGFHGIDVIIAGSYFRGAKTSGDIDVILATPETMPMPKIEEISELLIREGLIREIIQQSENHLMAIAGGNSAKIYKVDIRLIPVKILPFYLLYFASGETFSREIRQLAKERGLKLTETGLYRRATGKSVLPRPANMAEIIRKIKSS